jgi:hypothetical protein
VGEKSGISKRGKENQVRKKGGSEKKERIRGK